MSQEIVPSDKDSTRIDEVLADLQASDSTIYIGAANAGEKMEWFMKGVNSYVVEKGAGASADDEDPDPAILSVIGQITRDDSYLRPDGFYKGPSQYTKSLSDIKLSISVASVPFPSNAQNDFAVGCETIRKLKKERLTRNTYGCNNNDGVLFVGNNKAAKLRFRHKVFKAMAGKSEEIDDESFNIELTLDGYPIDDPVGREEKQKMIDKKTHELIPLPAFDITSGKRQPLLILPSDYLGSLQGAVVKIDFVLKHVYLSKDRKHTFTADVDQICALTSPLEGSLGLVGSLSTPEKLTQKRKLEFKERTPKKRALGSGNTPQRPAGQSVHSHNGEGSSQSGSSASAKQAETLAKSARRK